MAKFLTALPVFNEAAHVSGVLDEVLRFATDVLVVDDGSTDGTAAILARRNDVRVARHAANRGYGAALATAFAAARDGGWDGLVTIDCDGQHQPRLIPEFMTALAAHRADIVSGSRYLATFSGDSEPPATRRRINAEITAEINARLGLTLTDAFCGFKAYRVPALAGLDITDTGYAMPLQLWVQAVDLGWKIQEFAVPLIYLDEKRSFGGSLDDAAIRLAHYHSVLNAELERRGMSQRFTEDCGSSAK